MARKSISKVHHYARRVEAVMAMARPEHVEQGKAWYADAQAFCKRVAGETGFSAYQVAGVVAALSPRNRWARNLHDAEAYCRAARDGQPMPVACTFTSNRLKAWRILHGEAPFDVLSGLKVRSFIANILGSEEAVTVDVWALRAAAPSITAPTEKQYREIAEAFRRVGAKFGLSPMACQAAAWVALRGSAS